VRTPSWIVLSLVCGSVCQAGCVGTRTGNPGAVVPDGVELAQSELARIADPKLSAADGTTFGKDNRSFAFDLYGELSKKPGNLFYSPYSISTALAMTYAGARTETATEMEQALHFSLGQNTLHTAFNATDVALGKRKTELSENSERPQTGNGFELTLVNQAWGRKGYAFLDSYLDVLGQNYGAGLFLLDFGQSEKARTTINTWVQEQTKDRIKNLLPVNSISGSTALVLTNAIYFKASWQQTFDKSKTAPGTFHADTGDVSVDMMHQDTKLQYAAVGGVQMLSLPYVSTNVSMLLILPPDGDLALDVDAFDALQQKLSEHIVVLSLPKWSFESENPLKEPLMALGMEAAFGAADFSGMDGNGGLFISEVYHKAFVAVDEEGTEASAATAVALNESASPPVTLTFDRPFLFAIYDKPTGQVLFFGRVAKP
jgi:serpin B